MRPCVGAPSPPPPLPARGEGRKCQSIRPNACTCTLGPMNKKPRRPAPPAPSKSFFRTKEEQQKIIQERKQEEAALIEHLEGILDKIDQREARARARAEAQAKAQNLSPEETKALIKQAVEAPFERDKTRNTPTWLWHRKVAPVHNTEELRSELGRLLGIGKRD